MTIVFLADLLGTGIIIHTGNHGVNQGSSAKFGYIARNTIWNANAAHWFDDIKQVIFEHNTVRPAGTEMSWGNNIDNYSNGYCQHVFHAYNVFQHAYAGDRELMTFDPVNGEYFGAVQASADGRGLALQKAPAGNGSVDTGILGGMASVLDGTGAGQYRRIVAVNNSSYVTIDKPFTTPLDSTSRVQLGPFKGRILFVGNRYEDGGGFQLYANAADVVVTDHHFARTEALLSWGRAASSHTYAPNLRIQFVGNIVEEANHMWNWNATYPYPHPKTIEPYFIGVLGSDQDSQPCVPPPHGPAHCTPSAPLPFQGAINHLIVIKKNEIMNNGGIDIRGHTTNCLVADNILTNCSVGVHVDNTHASHVLLVNNTD